MKTNNKGFAISTLLYGIIIIIVLILMLIISMMAFNRTESKDMINEVHSELEGNGTYNIPTDKSLADVVKESKEATLDSSGEYYYKGEAVTNNVIFGGYCWKIIHTTTTDGVKMIFNGRVENNRCKGKEPSIGNSIYNSKYNSGEYNSIAKSNVDTWYSKYLTSYSNWLENTSGNKKIELIKREEVEKIGNNSYLTSGEDFWTESATGASVSKNTSINCSNGCGEESIISTSSGIHIVNSAGLLAISDNGTYWGSTNVGSCVDCSGTYAQYGYLSQELDSNNNPMDVTNVEIKCVTDNTSAVVYSCKKGLDCNEARLLEFRSAMSNNVTCCIDNSNTECSGTTAGSSHKLRPVVSLNSNVLHKGGTGDNFSPYIVDLGNSSCTLNCDTNGDGKCDYNCDTNGDGKCDYNCDTNGDGKCDLNCDPNGDGKCDYNCDTNGDGKCDRNCDTNGDGKCDLNCDTDGDGKCDRNCDTNGDGICDLYCDPNTCTLNCDTNGDGKCDLNCDTDGDGKCDLNCDTDGDGKCNRNCDTDGDGKCDYNCDTDGDGKCDLNCDTDGDGKCDYNCDTNGDGVCDLYCSNSGDQKVKVTYDYKTNGGTKASEKVEVVNGISYKIDTSKKGEKSGYEFIGWNTDKNAHNGIEMVEIKGNVTLYAIYKKGGKQINVKFNKNETAGEDYQDSCVTPDLYNNENKTGCVIISPSITPEEGYEVVGYNSKKGGTTSEWNENEIKVVTEDTEYYAIQSKTVVIDFNSNNSSTADISKSCTMYNASRTCEITAPEVTPSEGYTKIGWSTNANATTSEWNTKEVREVSEDAEYYALQNKTVTITFEKNVTKNETVTKSCTIYNGNKTCEIVSPAITPEEGYEVVGWSLKSDGTTNVWDPELKKYVSDSNTYYAIQSRTVTVTFEKNATKNATTQTSCTMYNGARSCRITARRITQVDGYTDTWWSLTSEDGDNRDWEVGTPKDFTEDVTYYAIQKKIVTIDFKIGDPRGVDAIGSTRLSCAMYNATQDCSITLASITVNKWFNLFGWQVTKGTMDTTLATEPTYYEPSVSYAISKDSTNEIELTTATEAKVKSITITNTNLNIDGPGKTLQLNTVLDPVDAVTELTWVSSNPSVATVSSTGLVTSVKTGSTNITVTTENGKTNTKTIAVRVYSADASKCGYKTCENSACGVRGSHTSTCYVYGPYCTEEYDCMEGCACYGSSNPDCSVGCYWSKCTKTYNCDKATTCTYTDYYSCATPACGVASCWHT